VLEIREEEVFIIHWHGEIVDIFVNNKNVRFLRGGCIRLKL
jgi:hypothetical protein